MNKYICTGNLTRDPELKYTGSGTAVCNFGLAINEKWKDSNGETQERVSFVDFVAWGRTAEVVAEYCKKGQKILVESKLEQQTWEDKETGDKRSKIVFNVQTLELLGTKGHGGGDGGDGGNEGSKPASKPASGANKKQQQQRRQEPEDGGNPDDVPF